MAGNDKPEGSPAPEAPQPDTQVPSVPPSSGPNPLEIVINTPIGGSGGTFAVIDKPLKVDTPIKPDIV